MKIEQEQSPTIPTANNNSSSHSWDYDDDDDVSIRSLFSSMESVNEDFLDDSSMSDMSSNEFQGYTTSNPNQSMSNEVKSKNSSTQSKDSFDYKSRSMNNLAAPQVIVKQVVKLPNINQNLQAHQPVIYAPHQPVQPVVVVKTGLQNHPPAFYNGNPQNRFVIAVPQSNPPQPTIYVKHNVPKLTPIHVESQNNLSPRSTNAKVIHHHYFYETQPVKVHKSKQQHLVSIVSNHSKDVLHHKEGENKRVNGKKPSVDESNFFKFLKKTNFSTSEFDLNDAGRIFAFNEFNLKRI